MRDRDLMDMELKGFVLIGLMIVMMVHYVLPFEEMYLQIPIFITYIMRFVPATCGLTAYFLLLFIWINLRESAKTLQLVQGFGPFLIVFMLVMYVPTAGLVIVGQIFDVEYVLINDLFYIYYLLIVVGFNAFFEYTAYQLYKLKVADIKLIVYVMVFGTAALSLFFLTFIVVSILSNIQFYSIGWIIYEAVVRGTLVGAVSLELIVFKRVILTEISNFSESGSRSTKSIVKGVTGSKDTK